MKAWKIITVAAFAVISVALIISYAFASMGGLSTYNPNGTYNPYGSYSPAHGTGGSMMREPMGGMMGSGYPSYGGYQTYPQQTPYTQQYGPWAGGYGGCPIRNG